MKACDRLRKKFENRGMPKEEIDAKFKVYFLYSKIVLVLYIIIIALLVFLDKIKTMDNIVIALNVIWIAVFVRLYFLFRKCSKAGSSRFHPSNRS